MKMSRQGKKVALYRGVGSAILRRSSSTIGVPVDVNKEDGLHNLIQRLRIKAESCRLAVTESDPQRRKPLERRKCIDRAGAVGAVVWMLWADPLNASLNYEWCDLGGAMDATAAAIETLERIKRSARGEWQQRREALAMLAEAQCMLRIAHMSAQRAVFGYLKHGDDPEQLAAFAYARNVARQEHCQIDRFLRQNDVACPESAETLREEISVFRWQCESSWGQGPVEWAVGGRCVKIRNEVPSCS
jgi:hypothetical protein